MPSELRATLLDYLSQHNTMTLATCGQDGPAAAGLFYVHDEKLRLYFLSEAKAQHARNLEQDARAAATVHEDYHEWRQIQGMQIRGTGRTVQVGREWAGVLACYLRKYPFVQEFIDSERAAGEPLALKIAGSRFFVIEPHWIRWIDNRAGFGRRREYDVLADMEIVRDA